MNNTRWSILYAGWDINTFFIINNEKDFYVCAVAYIDKFEVFSCNPINYLFKIIYFLRLRGRLCKLEFILNKIWFVLMPFSSGVFYKYRNYLYTLSIFKLDIVELENIKKATIYLKLKKLDLIVISVWPLLAKEIILLPKYKSINIHPSILPQYRGSLPTLWSLKNHDSTSAVTYMIIDPSMDTGNIIKQHIFSISEKDDWQSLENKITKIIEETFILDVKNYLLGTLKPVPQNDTVAPSVTDRYGVYQNINWLTETVKDIYNKINLYPLLDPSTYCYTNLGSIIIEIKKTANLEKLIARKHLDLSKGCFRSDFPFLFVAAKDEVLRLRLFRDIDIIDSMKLLFVRTGNFIQ